MYEIVVISGKGGTGKTSLTASFAALAKNDAVFADCDVDAADLHLVLTPKIKEKNSFYSGKEASIMPEACENCYKCKDLCRFDAIKIISHQVVIDHTSCEGCGVCFHFCPTQAISFSKRLCGEWYISSTRFGTMVHAKLGIAAENSGKLVSTVRKKAKEIAKEENKNLIITDGPPGIGCPVIASLAGANLALIVTEPTVSGEHDLKRVLDLANHFKIPTALCINKWDINPEKTKQIELLAQSLGAFNLGRIRYDKAVSLAQTKQLTTVEINSECGEDIKAAWQKLKTLQDK